MKTITGGSVEDPDPGSGTFLTLWIRGSGSGINNPDHISESLETIFSVKQLKILKSLMRIRDPLSKTFGSGIGDRINSDPGWKSNSKYSDPGSGMEKIRIRDKHSGSAILTGGTVPVQTNASSSATDHIFGTGA